MDIGNVIIQAIIQGLTEFLPISSSGHLSVIQHITGYTGETALILMIVLHLGTLTAVIAAFRRQIWRMIKEFFLMFGDIFTGKFSWRNMNGDRRMIFMVIFATLILIPVYFFRDFFTAREGDGDIIFEGLAFLFTAILLFIADTCAGVKTSKDMKIKDSVIVGLFQCVALFPGVSRSGSTTAAGLFCGLDKSTAVSFAFILGIPAILGGSVLELKEAISSEMQLDWAALGIGFAVSAIVGFLAIKLVKWLLEKDRFKIFGAYTAVIGVLCIFGGIWETTSGNTIASLFAKQ